jgi:Zn-dependent protease with chaperone function
MMNSQGALIEAVNVRRWPSETPLFVLVLLCAIACWIFFVLSIVGFAYVVMIGIFFFVSHVAFITHLRGSAVRVGPDQMPELHERIQDLSRRIGLRKAPTAYVMQAGGTLNALATKFFSSNFVVLFSDLLEACGDNTEARDMIIAHELGHLKAGHLRGLWLLLPGMFIPFLGSAYSRAREYTCDRYGFAVCQDRNAALVGMGILAAGGVNGPKVNLGAFANQRNDLNTTWMTLGRWLSTHPPLAVRIAAVEPSVVMNQKPRVGGAIGAVALIGCLMVVPFVASFAVGPKLMSAFKEASTASAGLNGQSHQVDRHQFSPEEIAAATSQARADMVELRTVIEKYRLQTGELPASSEMVHAAWELFRPNSEPPTDPFDGYAYGYERFGTSYVIWSEGPSSDSDEDDLVFMSEAPRALAVEGAKQKE